MSIHLQLKKARRRWWITIVTVIHIDISVRRPYTRILSMKIYINGITLTKGNRTKMLKATSFYVTGIEENGGIIFSKELEFRGLKGTALSAEFEALYYLLSPENTFKRYDVISTNSKIIPRWVKEGKEIKMSDICEFEFEIINHENKGKIIFEEVANLAKIHNLNLHVEKQIRKSITKREIELLPFL